MPNLPKHLAAALLGTALLSTSAQANLALEEIIVTAQKREQSLQDVPISVDVVSADTLDRRAITDTRSLAQASPSLNFLDGFAPSSTSFGIRGINSYTIEGSIQPSVSMVIDGVPLARNGEFVSELADIERVEILRGPQGTLFGRNATGGAINVVTTRPGDELEGDVDISYTSDDEQRYRVVLGGPLAYNLGAQLVAYRTDRDGHLENLSPHAPDLGGNESTGARAKIDWDFAPGSNALFTVDWSDTTHGFSPGVTSVPNNPQALHIERMGWLPGQAIAESEDCNEACLAEQKAARTALGQRVIDDGLLVNINDSNAAENYIETFGIAANIAYELNDSLKLHSITSYRDWEGSGDMDVDASPGQISSAAFGLPVHVNQTNLGRNPNGHNVEIEFDYLSQEFRLESTSDSVDWVAGLYYQDFSEKQGTDIELYFPASPNGPFLLAQSAQNTAEFEAFAIFADATFHLTDRLDLFAGLRWTDESVDAELDFLLYNALHRPDDERDDNDMPTNTVTLDAENNTVAVRLRDSTVENDNGVQATQRYPDGENKAGLSSDDWSGRLGINYEANDSVNMYASISRGFIGAAANIGRPESKVEEIFIKPSVAESLEFGIKSRLSDGVQLNAAMYIMEVTDLQTTVFVTGSGGDTLTRPVNAGDLNAAGVEADLVWSFNDNTRLTAGLSRITASLQNLPGVDCYAEQTDRGCDNSDTFDASGNDAPNTPELKFNLALDLNLPLNTMPFDGYANLTYTWQDDVFFELNNDPLLMQESYGLLDATLGIADRQGRYDLSLFGKNITDEYYVGNRSQAAPVIARVFARVPRGAQSYFGARLKYNF